LQIGCFYANNLWQFVFNFYGFIPVSGKSLRIPQLAERYAGALFESAVSEKSLEKVIKNIAEIKDMMKESEDFCKFVKSPIISRGEREAVISEISKKLKLDDVTKGFLSLLAINSRMFALSDIIGVFETKVKEHRGEMEVEILSAQKLNKEQSDKIATSLKKNLKKEIIINNKVDPSLIGGLVVKVGSRMVDSSVKSKLQRLQLAMKGVE